VRVRFALVYAALLAGTGAALVAPVVEAEPADPVLSLLVFVALAVLVIATAMWVGWLVAGRLLRPLDTINATAVLIGQGDLSRRVQLTGPDDEFANLARALNTMLDRLHRSLDAHRRFAANASHELRTPLATNKAMLSVALDDPADTDFLELARRLRLTNQESIDTVEALLDLAETEDSTVGTDALDLAPLVRRELDAARQEIEHRGVTVTSDLSEAPTTGSRVLWARLIANLVQNAVRHNHPGGEIWLATGTAEGGAYLDVENTGSTLPADLVPTLTEPFVRTRGRTQTGADDSRGLGLAIVASIAAAHRARVEVTGRDGGGLRVTVRAERHGRRATTAQVLT
jgi:two-component system sensor histidine kinase VanS